MRKGVKHYSPGFGLRNGKDEILLNEMGTMVKEAVLSLKVLGLRCW